MRHPDAPDNPRRGPSFPQTTDDWTDEKFPMIVKERANVPGLDGWPAAAEPLTLDERSGSKNRCTRSRPLHKRRLRSESLPHYSVPKKWTLTQPRSLRPFSEFCGCLVHERTANFRGASIACDRALPAPSILPPTGILHPKSAAAAKR